MQNGVRGVGERNQELYAWAAEFNRALEYAQVATAQCNGDADCLAEVNEELRTEMRRLMRELNEVCTRLVRILNELNNIVIRWTYLLCVFSWIMVLPMHVKLQALSSNATPLLATLQS